MASISLNLAGVLALADWGVVVCELAQPVRTEGVEPAVAHVAYGQPVAAHEGQRDHACHAPQFRCALGPLEISLLAMAMASRTRSAGVPRGRLSRFRITSRAIAAATSPAAEPPTPSITP